MRNLAILFIHLVVTVARLFGTGGARSIVAESLLVKHQLLILNRSRSFDAVLLTRVISQQADVSVQAGSSETKVTRKSADRAIDLFRYDYDELSEPDTFNISSTVVLSAEMFSAADEKRRWAIESTIANKEHVGQIIESAADIIMSQLRKDNLIGR